MKSLVFIDTNIFLDFYRVRGREANLAILKHIDQNHDRIISSNQVEMEYMKNRQQVIVEAYNQLKYPNEIRFNMPAFLAESKQAGAITAKQKATQKLLKTLKARVEKILRNPSNNDLVYYYAHRLFRNPSRLNLTRDMRTRFTIRRLAWKRFILGYPPRKPNDTSVGDAINWEWIVKCAQDTGNEIIIVSRDSDYGVKFGVESVLGDWLLQEFKERELAERER